MKASKITKKRASCTATAISAMLCNASVQSWCFCSIRYPSLGAGLSWSIRSFLLSPYPSRSLSQKFAGVHSLLRVPNGKVAFSRGSHWEQHYVTMCLTPETTKTKHKQHQATNKLQASPGVLGRDAIGAVDHNTWQCSNFQVGSGANALSRAQSSPSA